MFTGCSHRKLVCSRRFWATEMTFQWKGFFSVLQENGCTKHFSLESSRSHASTTHLWWLGEHVLPSVLPFTPPPRPNSLNLRWFFFSKLCSGRVGREVVNYTIFQKEKNDKAINLAFTYERPAPFLQAVPILRSFRREEWFVVFTISSFGNFLGDLPSSKVCSLVSPLRW